MANKYSTFYLSDLENMINQAAIDVIRNAETEGVQSIDCPMQALLKGVFDTIDGIMARLNDVEG